MKKSPLWVLVLLCACTKQKDVPAPKGAISVPEKCLFGQTQFNLAKRTTNYAGELATGNRPKGQPTNITTPPAVILLDFDGHYLAGTYWNTSGDIPCAPANLTVAEQTKILEMVTEDFRPFNVLVTTDEATFNAANIYKRMRVIVTETWEWYGQAGGTSYIGSFTWGDVAPCFVFGSLLNYNTKQIAEACSHEVGHTLGLRHQSSYDLGCAFLSEYNYGQGEGTTSWAPIMGVGYYKSMTTWHNGPNPYGCNSTQDDVSIITSVMGVVADDYGNSTNTAATLSGTKDGIINSTGDLDFFVVNTNAPKTITVTPFSTYDNQGSNLDLQINIYGINGALISSVNDPSQLGAAITLGTGKFFIGVANVSNQYAGTYGMIGKYSIALN